MNDQTKFQEQHTAGPQSIGFDYQFYYFMCLALQLKHGQKVGFEVKDDIHIDKEDGTTILFQAKHSILTKSDGSSANLTTLDSDLWKTLSNWAEMVKLKPEILENHSFCLVTNKSENQNKFIDALTLFTNDSDIDKVISTIKEHEAKTSSADLKSYIKIFLSLGKNKMRRFCSKLSIVTNTDDIIGEVKRKIFENIRNADIVETVFESLSSNMYAAKYVDIKQRQKFEITFEEFNSKFGKCFRVAFKDKPLPKRQFTIRLPDKLEDQTFIQQLLQIGDLNKNSPKIQTYTTQMLQVINHFSYWIEKNLLLPTELSEFDKNSILIWQNEFNSKYREVENKISSGTSINDLEYEIQALAVELIDYLRRENLSLGDNPLGIELSNGHFYALSDIPDIGWHFDWERKHKLT